MKMNIQTTTTCLALVAVAAFASLAHAGLNTTQIAIANSWPGSPVLETTSTPDDDSSVSNGGDDTNRSSISFRTTSAFQLDKFSIVAGAGPSNGFVRLYKDAVGGESGDGFVNVSFSSDLFTGNAFDPNNPAGLPFTFFGTGSEVIYEFDLTDTHELFLDPNSKYTLDFVADTDPNTGYNFFVRRGGEFYSDGNFYSRSVSPDDGQRFAVAGGTRDAPLALYAVPEPTSVALLVSMALAAPYWRRRSCV